MSARKVDDGEDSKRKSVCGKSDSDVDQERVPLEPDEPYKYAPTKDNDPWATLLAPELEADTERCKAWKDEVQNLLIFAGLFSAVVTAFVIESYKSLQPSGLNNSTPLPPELAPTPFQQKSPAVRINIFWFISLILSLTTVLIGTIALQWLREHQNYVGYSSKEKVAILHMRKQAADIWLLPEVFAVLPLLFQVALVLFFAGLIDFALPLGPKLTIAVSIVIGLTLLFLAVTTVLPSLQGLSFYCGLYPRNSLPTPCPYKSPQSLAFWRVYASTIRVMSHVFRPTSLDYDTTSPNLTDRKWIIRNPSLFIPQYLAQPVYNVWCRQNWLAADREWLSLRDVCHQRILDDDPDLYQHRVRWGHRFPLSDITLCLFDTITKASTLQHSDSVRTAAVLCFEEVAESVWEDPGSYFTNFDRSDRRDNYFQRLYRESISGCAMSTFLMHDGAYKYDRFAVYSTRYGDYIKPHTIISLFRDDHTIAFLFLLLTHHRSPNLAKYQMKLWLRVLKTCAHIPRQLALIAADESSGLVSFLIPAILKLDVISLMLRDSQSVQRFSDIADMLMLLVKLAAPNNSRESDDAIDVLFTHPSMAELFEQMGSWTDDYLRFSQAMDILSKQKSLRRIDAKFINLFDFIRDILRQNLTTSENPQDLDFFFYLSSIFVWYLLRWSPAQDVLADGSSILGQALRSFLGALYTSWSSGGKDEALESRFKGSDPDDHRFSEEWWNGIFRHANTASPLSGLPVTPKERIAPGAGDEDRTGTEHYLTINVGGPYDA